MQEWPTGQYLTYPYLSVLQQYVAATRIQDTL